ncbi:MAG TPA: hypothetical protein VK907_11315, partial [Phnomibacter sp.]|nr:hypothetical protein [Phnomibacter sp.]
MKYPNRLFSLILFSAILCAGCGEASTTYEKESEQATKAAGITSAPWGTVDEQPVLLYTLTNTNGTSIKITNYGGIVTSWITKDKNGNWSDVVVGYDSLAPYLQAPPYFGAIIGRYGNRIANATFSLDGSTYKLATNDGKNHLHGGNKGFDKVVWTAVPSAEGKVSLTLT